jgi:hypothetical protein
MHMAPAAMGHRDCHCKPTKHDSKCPLSPDPGNKAHDSPAPLTTADTASARLGSELEALPPRHSNCKHVTSIGREAVLLARDVHVVVGNSACRHMPACTASVKPLFSTFTKAKELVMPGHTVQEFDACVKRIVSKSLRHDAPCPQPLTLAVKDLYRLCPDGVQLATTHKTLPLLKSVQRQRTTSARHNVIICKGWRNVHQATRVDIDCGNKP